MKQSSQDDQVKAIHDMWRIFAIGENSVVELRAIWPSGIKPSQFTKSKLFHASKYSRSDEFKEAVQLEALRLNAIGYNVYTSLNPIKDGFSEGSVHDARSGPVCLNSDLSILSGISADSHAASLTVGSITA